MRNIDELYAYNEEAEIIFLGSLFYKPELISETIIRPEYLSPGENEKLLKVLYDMVSRNIPIELEFVVNYLGKDIDQVGGLTRLSELLYSVPTVANFKGYERLILESYKQRESMRIATLLKIEQITSVEAIAELTKLEELDENEADDDGEVKDALMEIFDELENSDTELKGSTTGYRDVDRLTSGLIEEDLIILAARPSVGKTAMMLNIANNSSKNVGNELGDVSIIFSVEMPKKMLLKRMIGFVGNIDSQLMRQAKKSFSDMDWTKTTNAIAELLGISLKIYDKSNITLSYIRKKVKAAKKEFPGRKINVFIDYLQLIQGEPGSKASRQEEISAISRGLKAIARSLKVSVTALSQLSRSVEQRQDKRPMLSDLRESGSIEQDADVVAFLYREDYYDKETENQNMVEVIIAKNRNGSTGVATLAFIKEFQKFVNIDWSQHQKEV